MENKRIEIKKLSGADWAKELELNIVDPKGWFSEDDYNKELITKWEFCNRAASSEIKLPENLSRRDMAKYREILKNTTK